MKDDNYLKESVIKCVDYAMKQDDDGKRRIFTGLFKYCDRLLNEDILVTCLKDEEKKKWFDNEMFKTLEYEKEVFQERIDKAIEYIEQKKLQPRLRTANTYSLQERQLLDILKGSDTNE